MKNVWILLISLLWFGSAAGVKASPMESANVTSDLSAEEVEEIVGGKKFYYVERFGKCVDMGGDWDSDPAWGRMRFNADVTRASAREFAPEPHDFGGEVEAVRHGVKIVDGEHSRTLLLSVHNDRFVYLEDLEGFLKLWSAKEDARKNYRKVKNTNAGFSQEMLEGKTFYGVLINTYERLRIRFTDTEAIVTMNGERKRYSYTLGKRGEIELRGEDGVEITIYLRRKTAGYLEVTVVMPRKQLEDRTEWFRQEYGRGVAGFGGSVEKLAKFFTRHGLMGHDFTGDGRIKGDRLDGEWTIVRKSSTAKAPQFAEENYDKLLCSVPEDRGLKFYTFLLTSDHLYVREDTRLNAMRLYKEKEAREAFRRRLTEGDPGVSVVETFHDKKLFVSKIQENRWKIVERYYTDDGKLRYRFFQPVEGRFEKGEYGIYRINEARRELIVKRTNPWNVRRQRVIEARGSFLVIREPEGKLTYLYKNRADALDGMESIDRCRSY